MEQDKRDRIRAVLHELVLHTVCDAELLNYLFQRGVFSVADVDAIAAERKHTDKAALLYGLLPTKTNSWEVLITALLRTDQADIVQLLETGVRPPTLEEGSRVRKILYDGESDRKRIRLDPEAAAVPSAAASITKGPIFDVNEPVPLFTGRKRELEEVHNKVQRNADGGGQFTVISWKILYDGESDRKRIRLDPEAAVVASTAASITKGPIFDVNEPVPLFTGRKRELQEVHNKVQRNSDGSGQFTVISQLTSISGLGGIGKTQLSRKYVQEHHQDYDDNCLWLNAESENMLSQSFRTLAKDQLGIPTLDANGTEKKIETVVRDVYKFFEKRKSLFIFDNAEREPWLKQFLPLGTTPPGQLRPFILLTSRTRDWDKGIEVIDLNELDLGDAVNFVKKGLGLGESDTSQDEIITKLVRRLQCFPLAIQQAISYIDNQQQMTDYDVSLYLEEFDKRQKELLSFDEMNIELTNDYAKTTLTTWTMTVEKIAQDTRLGGVALQILHAMAYLSPDKIEREMFLNLPGILPDEKESLVMGGVRLLVKYSMARGEAKQSLLSIHRLVQEVTRIKLVSRNEEGPNLEKVLKMMGGENQSAPLKYVDHQVAAYSSVWKYPAIVETRSYLPFRIVLILHKNGRDKAALQFAMESLDNLGTVLPKNHEDIFQTVGFIAAALQRQGKMEEAFHLVKSRMEKCSISEPEMSGTLDLLNTLGGMYKKESRYDQAFPYMEKVYELRRKNSKEDNPNFISSMQNFGNILLELGRAEEALEVMKYAYELRKKLPNPVLSTIQFNIGVCLMNLGRFEEALETLERAEEPSEATNSGRIHKANGLRVIGKVLRNLGRIEEALEKHRQAYQGQVDLFGVDNRESIWYSMDIGIDLSRLGRHDDAILVLEKGVQKLEALLGEDNFDVVSLKAVLADALARRGNAEMKDMENAEKILEEQRRKIKENGCEDLAYFKNDVCPDIAKIQKYLANLNLK